MINKTAIVWFRRDLRLNDNPAFKYAADNNYCIYPLFIFDTKSEQKWMIGDAAKWWLHKSLMSLNSSLSGNLNFKSGAPLEVLSQLVREIEHCEAIFWNRCYEPWQIPRDITIKKHFASENISVKSFNGSLLFEPQLVQKKDGTPYKVFTPFFKKGCLENAIQPELPTGEPSNVTLSQKMNSAKELSSLFETQKWHKKFTDLWEPGERGATRKFESFLEQGIKGYKEGRNYPSLQNVSGLSPHLHFGEISVNRIWHVIRKLDKTYDSTDLSTFLTELGWREFSHNLLFFNPDMPENNLQTKFDKFPWNRKNSMLKKWQSGLTGYPIVDAGMRELWETGYMHNRLRMITGSFLVKNLLLDWRLGQSWFWNCLFDADLANNSAGWQWVAGCGADAAPFFRIFNPILQSKKFDPEGVYIKKFVPELANLPLKYIHCPWEASTSTLKEAGVKIGVNYPARIVDLAATRDEALTAYKMIK